MAGKRLVRHHRLVLCFHGRLRRGIALMTRREFVNHERRCHGLHVVQGLAWFR